MRRKLTLNEAAARKGASKKSVQRAVEKGKLNSDFDPVTGTYYVHDDERLAQWQPGESGESGESGKRG